MTRQSDNPTVWLTIWWRIFLSLRVTTLPHLHLRKHVLWRQRQRNVTWYRWSLLQEPSSQIQLMIPLWNLKFGSFSVFKMIYIYSLRREDGAFNTSKTCLEFDLHLILRPQFLLFWPRALISEFCLQLWSKWCFIYRFRSLAYFDLLIFTLLYYRFHHF